MCADFIETHLSMSSYYALNVVVAFTPAEAEVLNEDAAKKLCQRLNDKREILLANGFGESEIISDFLKVIVCDY